MLDDLPLQIREKCLPVIYSVCGNQALVPRSLAIPLRYDPTGPVRTGVCTDVQESQHQGKKVAAKVLALSGRGDPEKIRRVGTGVAPDPVYINN